MEPRLCFFSRQASRQAKTNYTFGSSSGCCQQNGVALLVPGVSFIIKKKNVSLFLSTGFDTNHHHWQRENDLCKMFMKHVK